MGSQKFGDVNRILTPREKEIAELFAWGASKKEVATHLYISERTVENHTRKIYEKTGCHKINELSAWWFCNKYKIPFSLSPFARKIIAAIFLAIYVQGNIYTSDAITPRVRITRTAIRTRASRRSKREYEYKLI